SGRRRRLTPRDLSNRARGRGHGRRRRDRLVRVRGPRQRVQSRRRDAPGPSGDRADRRRPLLRKDPRTVLRDSVNEIWNPADMEFPRRYGPDDTLGALNEIGAENVRAAAALVREGRRYQLAQILGADSPAQMWRYWKHSLLLDRVIPGGYVGASWHAFLEESVAGALHSGSHLDGLAHIAIGELTYNGHRY